MGGGDRLRPFFLLACLVMLLRVGTGISGRRSTLFRAVVLRTPASRRKTRAKHVIWSRVGALGTGRHVPIAGRVWRAGEKGVEVWMLNRHRSCPLGRLVIPLVRLLQQQGLRSGAGPGCCPDERSASRARARTLSSSLRRPPHWNPCWLVVVWRPKVIR